MDMANSETFGIPSERAVQLRTLAKHHDIPIGDLIERWITAELDTVGLPDVIPGLEVFLTIDTATGSRLVRVDATKLPVMDLEPYVARHLSVALTEVTDFGGGKRLNVRASDMITITIARLGRGILIEVLNDKGTGGRRTLTPSIARHLARQLRRTADEAEA
jgi:hypothetical protein